MTVPEPKKPAQLQYDDDGFEDFPAHENTVKTAAQDIQQSWQDSWEDEDESVDFAVQLQ